MKNLKLSLAIFVGLTSFIYGQVNSKTVIILDASGSMWGQINGKTKIEMAKEALNSVVENWDVEKDGELGLTVYGHRKAKDCNDIESIVPIGNVDKSKIHTKIKSIQPKGKTPISKAIELEAAKLKKSGASATIILISDGIDSCNADPCKTVKRLKAEGIKFTLPVAGFKVDKKARKQLQCMADAGDGTYVDVENVADIINMAKPIDIIANDDNFMNKPVNGDIVGNVLENDELNNSKVDSSLIDISILEKQKDFTANIDNSGNLSVGDSIEPGDYNLKYKICEKAKTDNCSRVAAVSFTVKNINNFSALTKEKGKQISATYKFFSMGGNHEAADLLDISCSSSEVEPCSLNLPKGEYLVYVSSSNKHAEALVSIAKDKVLKEDEIQKIIVDLE